MHRIDRRRVVGLIIAALAALATGCGGDDAASGPEKDAGANEEKDTTAAADIVTSCKGIAAEHRRQFSQYDHQCAFLDDCAASGKCSCGNGCGSDKQMCNEALCKGVDSSCYCGDDCVDEPSKKPICPEFFCKQQGKFQVKGCHKLESCTFVDSSQDDKCQCTSMPDHAPTCWCGDTCAKDKPRCSAALCFGKDPNSCLVVPGKPHDACYCATCGLKGTKAACFLVLCP